MGCYANQATIALLLEMTFCFICCYFSAVQYVALEDTKCWNRS